MKTLNWWGGFTVTVWGNIHSAVMYVYVAILAKILYRSYQSPSVIRILGLLIRRSRTAASIPILSNPTICPLRHVDGRWERSFFTICSFKNRRVCRLVLLPTKQAQWGSSDAQISSKTSPRISSREARCIESSFVVIDSFRAHVMQGACWTGNKGDSFGRSVYLAVFFCFFRSHRVSLEQGAPDHGVVDTAHRYRTGSMMLPANTVCRAQIFPKLAMVNLFEMLVDLCR
ncbi:hypothetical protein BJ546DRAFT_662150 [Cryomyces antarcticus]